MTTKTTTADTVRAHINANAAERGGDTFLISPERGAALTFAQLKHRADDIGARLAGVGAAPGAKVAFLLDNGAWTASLFLGIMAARRVAVPLNAVAGPTQLGYVLAHCDAGVVFVAPRHRDKLTPLLAQVERDITVVVTDEHGPDWHADDGTDTVTVATDTVTVATDTVTVANDTVTVANDADTVASNTVTVAAADPALLLYTSGSTGTPKGALLSQRAVLSGGRNVAGGHHLTAADRALCVLPVYHINGAMVTLCAPLVSGGSVVMPARFSAREFWPLVAQHQCTWASVVPTMINYLLDRAGDEPFVFGDAPALEKFRFARSASAPLPATVLMQWEEKFKTPMIETLGLTETAGTVASNPMPPAVRKAGSVGRAFGCDIKTVNRDGDCAAGVAGEIVIRGDNLLTGYYKDAATTRDAFTGGWFRTGDLGVLDADGYLFITGRLKELIVRGGENIAPREVDDALYQHDAVLEAAAVGVAHRDYGQEVAACVVLRDGFECTEESLKLFCAARVGETKAPKKVYFLDELPKGPSGKILRLELPAIIASLTGG